MDDFKSQGEMYLFQFFYCTININKGESDFPLLYTYNYVIKINSINRNFYSIHIIVDVSIWEQGLKG